MHSPFSVRFVALSALALATHGISPVRLFGQAPTGAIVGTVIEAGSQRPLPNMSVVLTGAGRGTVTNQNGRYRLAAVPAGQVTLQVRGLGYRSMSRPVTVTAGDSTSADFVLTETAIQLDEVVVTGTGSQTEKRKLGNTVATISSKPLETAPVNTVSEVLTGREPGVVAMPGGGLTGEGAKIRIRGGASLSQSNEPIVYIDGVRVDNSGGFGRGTGQNGGSPSRLDDINPEAIERIEVLKGAAAATLYGTEAANGVIQIFTKRGSATSTRYDLHVEQGLSDYPDDAYAPHAGFARRQSQADSLTAFWKLSSPLQPYQVFSVPLVPKIFETGHNSTYSLSASGGAAVVNYFVNGRWQRENGPFGGRKWGPAQDIANHKQANASLTVFPMDKLLVRLNSNYTETHNETPDNNNNTTGTISLVINSKPELAHANNLTGAPAFATVREAMQQTTVGDVRRFGGSLNGNYKPFSSVTLDGTVGLDVVDQVAVRNVPFGWNVDNYTTGNVKGSRRVDNRHNRILSVEAKSGWDKEFTPALSSSFVVGGQLFSSQTNSNWGNGNEFPGPGIEVTGAGNIQTAFEEYLEQISAGTFAQEQVGFKNFAFVTVGARYDKHSAFGQSAGGAFYPKVSLSIVPSDLSAWHSSLISTLRFRGAIGKSGLQPGAFDKYTTFIPQGSELGAGLAPGNLGNPDLKPEVSTEWEGGFEVGLLRDRAAIDFTYWDRTVNDALVGRQFPVSGGFTTTQLDNIGQVKAHGIETGIKGQVISRPSFSLNLFANAAFLKQKVIDMGGAPSIKISGNYARYVNWIKEGYAPGSFFAPRLPSACASGQTTNNGDICLQAGQLPLSTVAGCTPSTEAALLTYFATPRSPDALNVIIDRCGQADINHYSGKPFPDWSGAFGSDMTFLRNFHVATLFEFRAGNYSVHDLTSGFRRSHVLIGRNTKQAAEVEAILLNPASTAQQRLDAAKIWATQLKALSPYDGLNEIYKADFIRWRELSLTYDVSTALAARVGARTLGITVSGRNLAIFTKFPGADPEMNALGRGASTSQLVNNFQEGINAWGLPIARRYAISVRAGF